MQLSIIYILLRWNPVEAVRPLLRVETSVLPPETFIFPLKIEVFSVAHKLVQLTLRKNKLIYGRS